MRPGPRRLLTLVFSAAALAAGWLVTGPASQLPQLPAPALALEALVTSAPRRPRAQPQAAAATFTATATVHSGQTLTALAHRYYHHANWWPRIWWANRAQIHNPDLIPAGAQLVIPAPRHPRWTTTRAALQAIPPPPPPPPPPAPAPAPQAPAAAGPAPSAPPAATGTVSAGSGFEQCVISRESGGNSQVMNSTGHYGLYQFSSATWAAYGGNPADFGNASPAEQQQVFDNAMATPGGASNWSPYDGCL